MRKSLITILTGTFLAVSGLFLYGIIGSTPSLLVAADREYPVRIVDLAQAGSVEIVDAPTKAYIEDGQVVIPDDVRNIDPRLFTCADAYNLGGLFVLDKLFDGSGMLRQNSTGLRDLLIIDSLLNDKCFFNGPEKKHYELGDLFVLDRLLDGDSDLFDSGQSSLEDLIILDQLFNGSQ